MSVKTAIDAIGRGEIVVVTDDENREDEGDLIMAAEAMTLEAVAFFLNHTSGLICVGLDAGRCDALELPDMVADNTESMGTAFTVSVDARNGTSTGISAHDRATTIRELVDPACGPQDFVRPGHVFPLRARPAGVLQRAGHTEAAVDLASLAGCRPGGVLCEVVAPDKLGMARRDELDLLAAEHHLLTVTIAELVRHRLANERLIEHASSAPIPSRHGDFVCHAFTSAVDGMEHLAFVNGDVSGPEPVLARVHSECLTGDVFGSARCDCGQQLDDALARIAREGRGVLVYLRGQEGRGIGIAHKLMAYNLQDGGRDTVDANVDLGLPIDSRDYGIGAQILRELGVQRLQLMTNNPAKYTGLTGYGIEIVERLGITPKVTAANLRYLTAKRDRLGHHLPDDLSIPDSPVRLAVTP